MAQQQDQRSLSTALIGRTFIHPAFDYVFIGGALSLVVIGIVVVNPAILPFFTAEDFIYFIFMSNNAHFAASTVRLYTKPDTSRSMPIVKIVLPIVALGLITLCMFHGNTWGSNLRALYFTWSPYHYAAQTYGLAVMYSYRSGCLLSVGNKRMLWWVAMLPFFYNFALAPMAGMHWIDVAGWLDNPSVVSFLNEFRVIMPYVAFATIPLLFWRIWRSEANPMPLISGLMLFTNSVWWFTMSPAQAFVWATIFHGIQYLAIVIIFHVKDQMKQPGNRHGVAYHTIWFYGACFLLGYGLFRWFPYVYVFAGFTPVASVMYTVAMINVHHFIVDAFIWRLKKSDSNRGIVDSGKTESA